MGGRRGLLGGGEVVAVEEAAAVVGGVVVVVRGAQVGEMAVVVGGPAGEEGAVGVVVVVAGEAAVAAAVIGEAVVAAAAGGEVEEVVDGVGGEAVRLLCRISRRGPWRVGPGPDRGVKDSTERSSKDLYFFTFIHALFFRLIFDVCCFAAYCSLSAVFFKQGGLPSRYICVTVHVRSPGFKL